MRSHQLNFTAVNVHALAGGAGTDGNIPLHIGNADITVVIYNVSDYSHIRNGGICSRCIGRFFFSGINRCAYSYIII